MARSSDEIWRVVLAGSGWPPIWCAASLGDTANLRRLLAEGADPNAIGDQECTPLHVAAEYGHQEAIELLLSSGADPNRTDSHGNGPLWTAVHQACLIRRTDANLAVVRLLLSRGADPNQVNRYGRSPREIAHQGDEAVAALFAV